jgi:hypothetical protein
MEELDQRLYSDTQPMSETIKFIRYCDRSFDLSNVRSADSKGGSGRPSESRRNLAPDLAPFRSPDDPRLAYFKEFQDYLYAWHEENWKEYGIGEYKNFLSSQCYKAAMMNTASIPAFIRWALDTGYDYVLTGILQTDDVESVNAEIRQAGGDRRNPTVQEALNAIPQINLAKQSMKLISLPRGTNVDPQLLADPALASNMAWAKRLASAPAIAARPTTSIAARAALPKPFQQKFFYGKHVTSCDLDHVFSVQELKQQLEPSILAKKFKRTQFNVELVISTPEELAIFKLDGKGLTEKTLQGRLAKASIVSVPPGSPNSSLVFVQFSKGQASAKPISCIAFKLKPSQEKAREFVKLACDLFVSSE